MKIIENYPLLNLNTFGLDIKAKYFTSINTVNELIEIKKTNKFKDLELLVLGGGSNILFTKDFDGLVILNNIKGKEIIVQNHHSVFLKIGAGENWHELVMYCVDKGWGGIENLSLIPGNTGTAPMQNIGAYGVEIKETFVELEALEILSGKIVKFNNSDCEFGYRESVFKNKMKNQYIILNITLELKKNPVFNVNYGDVKTILENQNIKNPSIKDVSNAIISIRRSKLPDPKKIGNSGSFFKNPIVSLKKLKLIQNKYPKIISYKINENEFKIAAGWMIEIAGWKGKRFNNFGVHEKQALVLVNYGLANGMEIFNLSEKIILDIKDKFGITLEREVNII
ncbi:UDP-N-acetylmuramate dehydrogenase [Flavobacteriales bacterium]|jgi:UDP-N-acetylmuramate dehydrogenase|nr:UDP-N-acetylmuramate dehydrogenase [Flavobacteriales bacterium]